MAQSLIEESGRPYLIADAAMTRHVVCNQWSMTFRMELYDWTDVSHRGSGSAAEAGRYCVSGNGIRAVAPAYAERAEVVFRRDLVVLRRIRTLLHEQGITIEGARRVLERNEPESGDGKASTRYETCSAMWKAN